MRSSVIYGTWTIHGEEIEFPVGDLDGEYYEMAVQSIAPKYGSAPIALHATLWEGAPRICARTYELTLLFPVANACM